MELEKHVDFNSLLSKAASSEAIVKALRTDTPDGFGMAKIAEQDKDHNTAAELGVLGGGGLAVSSHLKTQKQLRKLEKRYHISLQNFVDQK